jgi:hypothetical protein
MGSGRDAAKNRFGPEVERLYEGWIGKRCERLWVRVSSRPGEEINGNLSQTTSNKPKVAIIGGGFGGLYAA